MNRRKFLSVLSGAVAAVAGGLGLAKPNVSAGMLVTFGAGKPYEKTVMIVPGQELEWLRSHAGGGITYYLNHGRIWGFYEREPVEISCSHICSDDDWNFDALGGLNA